MNLPSTSTIFISIRNILIAAIAVLAMTGEFAMASTNTSKANNPYEFKFVVTLQWRNVLGLRKLISEQADPRSPEYRHYLTESQFVDRFGPSNETIGKVMMFLQKHHLKVTGLSANCLLLTAEGSIADIQKAFPKAQISLSENGHITNTFPMVAGANLPNAISGIVASIHFNSISQHLFNNITPASKQAVKQGFIYGPKAIATLYKFPNVNNIYGSKAYSGKGVTIAVASFNSYSIGDIQKFWKIAGVKHTGTIKTVLVDGAVHHGYGSEETTLDLEQVTSQAPGANIITYLGTSATSANEIKVFNKIVTQNKASVVTYSWGTCEPEDSSWHIATMHQIFLEGQAQGIAFFVASGDAGAYACSVNKHRTDDVNYPASDPVVTAVGGTTLYTNKFMQISRQTAWRGSGSGVSWVFLRPSWQFGFGLPRLASKSAHTDHRYVTDVSLDANPRTGYFFVYKSHGTVIGGTSAASPNMAALWALADQAAHARIGDTNQEIYRIARSVDYHKAFYNVTSGNDRGFSYNFMQLMNGDTGHRKVYFKAHPGYNLPTGWGSPWGNELVKILAREQKLVDSVK